VSRVRIYGGGSGRLRYDTAGERRETNEHVARDFGHGILFYHDPSEAIIRCYVKLARMTEEQFVVVYNGDPSDDYESQVRGFKTAVREAIGGTNWSVVDDGSRNQVVYDRLGTPSFTGEAVVERVERRLDRWLERRLGGTGVADLEAALADAESADGVDFRVGDPKAALATVEFVRRRLTSDGVVAVSRSGRTRSLEHADVVVGIDEGAEGVELEGELADSLRRRGRSRAESRAREALDALRTGGRGDAGSPPATAARALRTAGVESRLGFGVEAGGTVVDARTARTVAAAMVLAGVAAFCATLVALWPARVGSLFGRGVAGTPIPAGAVGAGAVVAAAGACGWAIELDRLRGLVGTGAPPADGDAGGGERARLAVDALADVYALSDADGRDRVDDVVRGYGLSVVPASRSARRRRLVRAAVVGAVLLSGAVAVAVGVLAGERLLAAVAPDSGAAAAVAVAVAVATAGRVSPR
jgi:hypothetical protein